MSAKIHEGGCLCGAVRYRVIGEPNLAAVCHCTRCKRMTGSAFSMPAYFDEAAVQIISGVLKTYESRSDETNRWLKLARILSNLWNDRDMDRRMGSWRSRDCGRDLRRSQLD
jgi:Glutathione-dependent formaldehyde-activating enzyme